MTKKLYKITEEVYDVVYKDDEPSVYVSRRLDIAGATAVVLAALDDLCKELYEGIVDPEIEEEEFTYYQMTGRQRTSRMSLIYEIAGYRELNEKEQKAEEKKQKAEEKKRKAEEKEREASAKMHAKQQKEIAERRFIDYLARYPEFKKHVK